MIELLRERPGERLPLPGPENGRPGTRTRMTRVLVAGDQAELTEYGVGYRYQPRGI